jgi:hypothetical protein
VKRTIVVFAALLTAGCGIRGESPLMRGCANQDVIKTAQSEAAKRWGIDADQNVIELSPAVVYPQSNTVTVRATHSDSRVTVDMTCQDGQVKVDSVQT